MTPERKTIMVSLRMPAALVARADFAARNNDAGLRSRSEVLQTALERWLPGQEQRMTDLGIIPKKTR